MRKFLFFSIMLLLAGFTSWAQRAVTGRVTDANGMPVPGATIQVKGTNVGTISREDGTYTITVPNNGRTLVVSAVGQTTYEVTVGSQTAINITMQPANQQNMQEVVVVGYGTQRRREVTGSLATVRGEAVANKPVQSFEQALAGRATGVQITVPNGVLNNPPVFRIRGTNSISLSSYPLIVVDGVVSPTGDFSLVSAPANPLASINPNDIESIDIAKDAASAAIYGSRAANGVVFITTKRGRTGRARVNVETWTGWTKPFRTPEVMDAFQYTDYKNLAAANNPGINSTNPAGANYTKFALTNDANGNPINTNWADFIYRTGFQYNTSINVSGGSENTSYYLSAGFTNQQGMIRRNTFRRGNTLFNIDSRVTSRFTVGGKISYSNEFNGAAASSGSLPGENFATAGLGRLALVNAPNVGPYRNDGSYNVAANNVVGSMSNSLAQVGFYNPAPMFDLNRSNAENNHIQSNIYAQVKPFSWMTLRTQYGIDYLFVDNEIFQSPVHGDGFAAVGNASSIQGNYKRWIWTNTATFEHSINDIHNFNLLVGQEQDRRTSRSYGINRQNLTDPAYNVVQAGYTINNPTGLGFGENYLLSGFSRLNYNFNRKYYFSANVRQDEYSALGEKKGIFWGGSLGWEITRENFWQSAGLDKVFSNFKVRGSYGKVGNISGIGDYAVYSTFGSALYGGNAAQTFTSAGNTQITWETSKKLDVGFSFGMFRDRLTGEFAYYKNDIDDLILGVPQSPSTGLPSTVLQNVGTMYNKGLELMLSGTPIQSRDFTWTSTINVSTNRNMVTALAPGLTEILTATQLETVSRTQPGYPLGYLWVVRSAGIDPSSGRRIFLNQQGEKIFYQFFSPTGQFTWTKEDGTRYNNPNGSARNITQAADAVMYANVLPKMYGGFDNTFRYRGFELNILTTFQTGFYVYYGTNAGLHDQRFWNNSTDLLGNYWTKPGENAKWPKPVFNDNVSNGSAIPMDINVFKGDFLKVRELGLAYTLPKTMLDRAKINSVRLFARGQNLAIITKYPGPDPEVSSNGNSTTSQGVDRNTVPNARTFIVGVNVGF
jgi:TonB-linked SusC/RagA family outer membrane protein